ncbi:(Fe-S)-binding protein [Myroides marinus]|uniref:4Fe-4S dicluster domain-containing protein n=1 Tax=Myroides TaxID=76831 RepID=UPI0025754911|nr:4Fe-4S dicluster domain-containing protein [Myroides marinus]MDM1346060.1 (Fe-S)-binding protein [Myroides marinus]MDM1350888.1 (Fe-S)-binding protein [Myroides marinus]MDM1353314.1 (Fe-S)-binding protein [Myroides marinus]MDM1358095.1 (Fe-S)-binding protein [Myroides marinus]MDM1381977.1 (Fe-S)-binding protein [Myroides marinus]
MEYLGQVLFLLLLVVGFGFFIKNIKKLIRNIKLGRDIDRTDNSSARWKNMIRVALGQSKMVKRPIPAILHIFVYAGFVIINIEMLEIIVDGLFGTHRAFSFLGAGYNALIGIFEVLAFLVIFGVVVFWIRRNVIKLKRFNQPEMEGWAKRDANNIIYIETTLMCFFLIMNAADYYLQSIGYDHYTAVGSFPISSLISPIFEGVNPATVAFVERFCWWAHIAGVMVFMNYLYYSKHLHIFLAFPNTYYANLKPQGEFNNLESVKKEVSLMMDPNADPYAAPAEPVGEPEKFGAQDVMDLNWVQLLNAYSCTECGRCTSSCPQNTTGKKLSPRKIMMSTRDRLEDVSKILDANNGKFVDDGKTLLNDYITPEELWACNTCNACVEECPIDISPLSIIMDMRRFLVMEQSAAPVELNNMMQNVENNAAPWQYNQMDRLNWKDEN